MNIRPRRLPVAVSMTPLGISAFTSRHAPDFRMPLMSHTYEKLCFVEAGRGKLQWNDQAVWLEQGAIARVPAQIEHRFVDDANAAMTLSVLCIDPTVIETNSDAIGLWRELAALMPMGTILMVGNTYLQNEIRRLFRSVTLELGQNREARSAMIVALAVQLLVMLRRGLEEAPQQQVSQPSSAFLSSVAELEDRFADTLRIGELAQRAGMCYRSFTSCFRRHKGMTVIQYVTQRRIEFSQRRMLETGDILGSALESGFHDLSHFYRVFKRIVGHTPLEFIRSNEVKSNS